MRRIEDQLADLDALKLRRHLRQIQSPPGPVIAMQGRTLINFSSNDYLGLATSPLLKESLQAQIDQWGVGSGSSRLVCGSHSPHHELEERIARFKGTAAAVCFSSGYAAALGTITALVSGEDDVVIMDKLSHASLIDGARLSGATIRIFPHNNLNKLQDHLRWARDRTPSNGRILVITESIFSMDGDSAPLSEIVDLKDQYNSALLIDEAHAFGILGPSGRGLAAQHKVTERIDFHLGTLSKAAGLSGGFVAGSKAGIDFLINRSRSLVYSTAPPPALAATAILSLEIIESSVGSELRAALRANTSRLARILGADEGVSAILPFIVGDEARALSLSEALLQQGVFVPAIRYPTVARGKARLRFTTSANHSELHFEKLNNAVKSSTSTSRSGDASRSKF